jgi:hypothetical protein
MCWFPEQDFSFIVSSFEEDIFDGLGDLVNELKRLDYVDTRLTISTYITEVNVKQKSIQMCQQPPQMRIVVTLKVEPSIHLKRRGE